MPSAEETTYLIGVMPDGAAQADAFLARDVDLLVSQIKENLRLSSLKAKSSISHKSSRPSPYRVPARSWADPAAVCEVCGLRSNVQQQQQQMIAGHHHHHHQHHHHHLHHHHHHHHHYHNHLKNDRSRVDDDPYEVLQELLREGGLIKEAVKRLQENLDELSSSEVDEDDVVDDEDEDVRESGGGSGYRRKPYFYDSEDEPLPPMYEPLEL
ncbi:PREDICTED: GSK-3-binding protein-like [Vollenhovia emeryi]|uniref:GSK-3-binding protein-like n=1 Tax=Vollenhovia emeryi TaxID=411798 RepID=UPI0005F3D0D0|nr:PREDICTED: GSK-3-binding protein-like [Vollenhovia emeryi]